MGDTTSKDELSPEELENKLGLKKKQEEDRRETLLLSSTGSKRGYYPKGKSSSSALGDSFREGGKKIL